MSKTLNIIKMFNCHSQSINEIMNVNDVINANMILVKH